MKKLLCHGILSFWALFLLATPGLGAVEITLFNWQEYISQDVIDRFTKETGIAIKQIHFDSDQVRDEVISSTAKGSFDIVLFDSIAVQVFGKSNYLHSISDASVPNLENIDQRWSESCGNFGIPYFYGSVGIVYDASRVNPEPDSWRDLLEPKEKHRGHVSMVEDMTDVLIPPLMLLGYNINSEEPAELREAYELLLGQLPYLAGYRYVLTEVEQADAGNDIHMALAYSGDQYVLNDFTGTDNWQYVVPKEGTAVWVDCLSVIADSSNKDEALRFLNYLLDPAVSAENTEEIYYASPNGAIRDHLSKDAADDPELFWSEEVFGKVQHYRIISDDNLRLRKRMLDTLKKRYETQ